MSNHSAMPHIFTHKNALASQGYEHGNTAGLMPIYFLTTVAGPVPTAKARQYKHELKKCFDGLKFLLVSLSMKTTT